MKGAYREADEATRRQVAQLLVNAQSPLRGPDAWKRAAELHRDAFVDAMIERIGRSAGRLPLLREVTFQDIGNDSDAWRRWKALRRR